MFILKKVCPKNFGVVCEVNKLTKILISEYRKTIVVNFFTLYYLKKFRAELAYYIIRIYDLAIVIYLMMHIHHHFFTKSIYNYLIKVS
jgi:hypothetical protein